MEDGFGVRQALTDIFGQLSEFLVALVPRLITGLVVLLLGILIAKIVEKVLGGSLSRIRFDSALERVGITPMLEGIGIRGSISRAIARLVYIMLVVLFAQGAANAVGMVVISQAIASFFAYLPHLVAAVLILLLGNTVGQFAGRAVAQSAQDSGVDYAPALGRAVSAAILFIVAIMAIAQLGIDTAMIRTVVIAGLAGGAAAFALSFGLGTREVTHNVVAGFYIRKLFRIGEEMEVRGTRGTLAAITPTKTLLESEGRTVAVANRHLMEEDVRQ